MPEPVYRRARAAAQRLVAERRLVPPFDVDAAAREFVHIVDEELPIRADCVVLHAGRAGEAPIVALDERLSHDDARRRVALAHALGHVVLAWHPLGCPCDIAQQPQDLPVTSHEFIEGEASAFARELLAPTSWIVGFDALDRPAQLIAHVADRAGIGAMAAARAIALHLPAGTVWAVTDTWGIVLDAGRSPGTLTRPPRAGDEVDAAQWARTAQRRHRASTTAMTIDVWELDPATAGTLPRDLDARTALGILARQRQLDDDATGVLQARLEGVAGWVNERVTSPSMRDMQHAIEQRSRETPDLRDVVDDDAFTDVVHAKATELVSRRLAR